MAVPASSTTTWRASSPSMGTRAAWGEPIGTDCEAPAPVTGSRPRPLCGHGGSDGPEPAPSRTGSARCRWAIAATAGPAPPEPAPAPADHRLPNRPLTQGHGPRLRRRSGNRALPAVIFPFVQAGARDEAHARLVEVLPALFRRLVVGLPNEVEGLAKVTTEQFGVLAHILDRGSVSMGELAIARNVALNTATSLVDRLVTAGLVERRGDPDDRRVVRVAVTERGRVLVERLRTAREAVMRRMFDDLGDEEIDRVLAAMPAL